MSEYYQKDKERIKKSLVEGIKILLKKKNIKSENVVENDIEIFQKLIKKG